MNFTAVQRVQLNLRMYLQTVEVMISPGYSYSIITHTATVLTRLGLSFSQKCTSPWGSINLSNSFVVSGDTEAQLFYLNNMSSAASAAKLRIIKVWLTRRVWCLPQRETFLTITDLSEGQFTPPCRDLILGCKLWWLTWSVGSPFVSTAGV